MSCKLSCEWCEVTVDGNIPPARSDRSMPFADVDCDLAQLHSLHQAAGDTDPMLKKISISQVDVGMFVNAVEGNWLDHSLWKTRFLIMDEKMLDTVRTCGAAECWIDISQGTDVAPEPPEKEPLPVAEPVAAGAPVAKPVVRKPMAAALLSASSIVKRSGSAVTTMFDDARTGNSMRMAQCDGLVAEIIESVEHNADALVSLCRLKLADEYAYMHSVSVCALMVSLGRQLGLDDAMCRDAGMAGLLHDIGMAAVPRAIVNKPGKLDDDEIAIVRSHTVKGTEMLLASGIDNERVLDAVRHHHERMDGSGYPDNLAGDQISLLARMCAVCDVYDAVTSNRPWRQGWDPAESVARMASWQGHFDSKVLQTFVKTIGIYPVGSLVRMHSGRLGVVVEQNPKRLTSPKVKLFFSTKTRMPIPPILVNLMDSHVTDRIAGREPPGNWSFGYLNDI